MTREELTGSFAYRLTQASTEYYQHNRHTDSMTAFEDGAEWAKADIIRKACDVLEAEGFLGVLALHLDRDKEYFVEKFTKALEEY